MSSSTTSNATIRVLGPNGKITFEGEEVLIEEEVIPASCYSSKMVRGFHSRSAAMKARW